MITRAFATYATRSAEVMGVVLLAYKTCPAMYLSNGVVP
jgi:hypothetical protein